MPPSCPLRRTCFSSAPPTPSSTYRSTAATQRRRTRWRPEKPTLARPPSRFSRSRSEHRRHKETDMKPELQQGLDHIEQVTVQRLEPIEWLLTPAQIGFLRLRIAQAIGDVRE